MSKAAAGWFSGCNSNKNPYFLPDNQYRWGVNVANRGGLASTRPGYSLRLSIPDGNFQGYTTFNVRDANAPENRTVYHVFAVDGAVYAHPVGQPAPADWDTVKLGFTFDPDAKRIYWAKTEKTVASNASGGPAITPSVRVLMIQDGVSPAAAWDGTTETTLSEVAPDNQTPTGTWMEWSGNRLWVAVDNTLVASDLGDPFSFTERTLGTGRGDFIFTDTITGLANSTADANRSSLMVFTLFDTETLDTSELDREEWNKAGFRKTLYPGVGCVAGRSITLHAGLLWWYSSGGLINSDAAAAAFLTSQLRYRDVEMAQSKRNLAPDLSNICSASFESYLLMSVPHGDPLNAHTMVLDYSVSDEFNSDLPPAWSGVWTGTRPVEWSKTFIDGEERIFYGSVDYQSADRTFNHIWEAFQPNKYDSYEITTADNARVRVQVPIYCSFETKLLGDGLDLKKFKFFEADVLNTEGTLNIKGSYAGSFGGYRQVLEKKVHSNTNRTSNAEIQALYDYLGAFRPQSRRLRSETAGLEDDDGDNVQSEYCVTIDKAFSIYLQWCGWTSIEAIKVYMEPWTEESSGDCEDDEDGIRVLTEEGRSFIVAEEDTSTLTADESRPKSQFSAPFYPGYPEVFYSSIPVAWEDLDSRSTCLPCARATFTPPVKTDISINGEKVY